MQRRKNLQQRRVDVAVAADVDATAMETMNRADARTKPADVKVMHTQGQDADAAIEIMLEHAWGGNARANDS